jgi:hypothetical protein
LSSFFVYLVWKWGSHVLLVDWRHLIVLMDCFDMVLIRWLLKFNLKYYFNIFL